VVVLSVLGVITGSIKDVGQVEVEVTVVMGSISGWVVGEPTFAGEG